MPKRMALSPLCSWSKRFRDCRGRVNRVCSDRPASSIVAGMNDVSERARAKPAIVRPRDAASLILLRGAGRDLELLAGRRPGHVRFMPGAYVFPAGAIDP